MKPDEIKHLLGGYATGTLTPEEQKALFDAALADQDLFDALAREQTLKDALNSPAVRRELMDALEARPGWRERVGAWFRWPYALAGAGALAAAALTVVAIVQWNGPGAYDTVGKAPQVAEVRTPASEQPAATAAQPRRESPQARRSVNDRQRAKSIEAGPKPEGFALSAPPLPPATAPAPSPAAPSPAEQRVITADSVRQEANSVRVQNAPAPEATGVAGGVIGGYPAMAPGSIAALRSAKRAAAESVRAPLSLRYSVREPKADPPQLTVEATADSVLYIFRRDSNGAWLAVSAGGISLKANSPVTTPPIAVSAQARAPRALLVLSRTPLTNLAQTGAALTSAVDRLLAQSTAVPVLTGTSVSLTAPVPADVIVAPLALP